jgi:formylglycine-generating enzyme required for sulfatase activity
LIPLVVLLLVEPGPVAWGPPLYQKASPRAWRNSLGMEFVRLPAGRFRLGSPDGVGHSSEHPRHEVALSRPFHMGKTPVTTREFRAFVQATGYKTEAERSGGATVPTPDGRAGLKADANWTSPGFVQTDREPVVCVSWNDAQAFIAWLNAKEGTKAYRLPTEAEWEYACRAGSEAAYGFGDDPNLLVLYAWTEATSGGRTHPVGLKKANAWGLFDMHGHVWQWCQDWFDEKTYGATLVKDPTGAATGQIRVMRGGSWYSHADRCRAAFRGGNAPTSRFSFVGFRVVKD